MNPLTPQTQALYSELVERLLAESGRRDIGKAPGTFTTKKIGGETYAYFQYSEPGGRYRQLYLGKKSPDIDRLISRYGVARQEEARARAEIERLCAQIILGGGFSVGSGPGRVLRAFADAGLFEAGLVLVGTHAFGLLGNMLGVRWSGAHHRTEDIDLAGISLAAASGNDPIDASGALERLEMGFLPVPGLDPRHPTTSFKVRGGSLRVDFLTPGRPGKPVALKGIGTCAQPLPFLEYLIESPERAAVLDSGGFLVLVPPPARFALHKLLIAGERGVVEHGKALKDMAQAAEILKFLAAERPGDIRLAAKDLERRRWGARFARAWRVFVKRHPEAAAAEALVRQG